MSTDPLHHWAQELVDGQISATELRQRLLRQAATDLGHTLVDVDRARRCGFPEVVYGQGKSAEELVGIARSFAQRTTALLITRIDPVSAELVRAELPGAHHNSLARTLRWAPSTPADPRGSVVDSAGGTTAELGGPLSEVSDSIRGATGPAGLGDRQESALRVLPVAVLTAGTTDRPVAEEALETLAWMNVPTRAVFDVGVAGPLRLWSRLHELEGVAAVVTVAGMEGALPSVVGGWVRCPVIAVPTSVGYGANLQGVTALLGMLIGCSANVAVVNIDAGFKGGYLAGLIATRTRWEAGGVEP